MAFLVTLFKPKVWWMRGREVGEHTFFFYCQTLLRIYILYVNVLDDGSWYSEYYHKTCLRLFSNFLFHLWWHMFCIASNIKTRLKCLLSWPFYAFYNFETIFLGDYLLDLTFCGCHTWLFLHSPFVRLKTTKKTFALRFWA